MRYVLFFNDNGQVELVKHFQGKKINVDEEVKKIKHPNFKRFNEKMLMDILGNDSENFREKLNFIELDKKGNQVFNKTKYDEAMQKLKEMEQKKK